MEKLGISEMSAKHRLRDIEIYPTEVWPVHVCPRCKIGVEYLYGMDGAGRWTARCYDQECATYVNVGPLACIYCAEVSTLKEHIIPASKGGATVVPGCFECNGRKLGKMPFTDFRCPGRLSMVVKREAVRILTLLGHALLLGDERGYPPEILLRVTLDIRWWDQWIERFEKGGHNMPRAP